MFDTATVDVGECKMVDQRKKYVVTNRLKQS